MLKKSIYKFFINFFLTPNKTCNIDSMYSLTIPELQQLLELEEEEELLEQEVLDQEVLQWLRQQLDEQRQVLRHRQQPVLWQPLVLQRQQQSSCSSPGFG
jgi:hypothetical protein